MNVRLGYAIGSGEPVDIPVRHLVVTGQTQEAGKTTALEALITRSGLKALAFVTKRGEGAFADAHEVRPYFKEEADWEFVKSLLEAARNEKLKFETSWIIKASAGARTLAEVHKNVRKLLETARGINESVYTVLDAYLEIVVPQIARVRWADTIELEHGINVMDLRKLSTEMQQLVIRSALLWVLEHENETVVVVPEAWQFVPQGRNTPVRRAAERFIRLGATLGNYLWIDSQDIAGVDKPILKMVPVWVLGVQRESNEIKRTLDQIPAGVRKPKAEEIALLGLGEFIACYGKHTIPTYAQPTWMSDNEAAAIARGDISLADYAGRPPKTQRSDTVKESEARELRRNNAELSKDLEAVRRENHRLLERLEALEATAGKRPAVARAIDAGRKSEPPDDVEVPVHTGNGALSDAMYQAIRSRLVKDPVVLKVIATKPQLDVEVTRETIAVDGKTWLGLAARLVADGFFDDPRKVGDVYNEGKRIGFSGVRVRADEAVKKLVVMGFLTREGNTYLAVPDMKVNVVER